MPKSKKIIEKKTKIQLPQRVMIERVQPEIDGGSFPIKRVEGEKVTVRAHVYTDGHEEIAVMLLYRREDEKNWHEVPMRPQGNDEWEGSFYIGGPQAHYYTVTAWMDHFATWRKHLVKKCAAAQDVNVDLMVGLQFVEEAVKISREPDTARLKKWMKPLRAKGDSAERIALALSEEFERTMRSYPDRRNSVRYGKELAVQVDRPKASFSSWYELFPRSFGPGSKHGTFKDVERLLPQIAQMGFDVLYLPPIHPIGKAHRKGKNNSAVCTANDPGSPWAIGSKEGGHTSIHPQLGTVKDFKRLVEKAQKDFGIEVALDLAFQCSPDHPYVKQHPQWFVWRPDGTVQYAENPPKKYEDIYPINFESSDWENLWQELKSIVLYWIKQGVRIFRVDNPHTKPFAFWDWLIKEIRQEYPDVIFLSEAFTRPKVTYRLAKVGFHQSYTYFTWRNTKREFIDYLTELTQTEVREYFRPNFWTNTPDILPEHLQYGGRPAFMMRAALAATLSSNYGVYGPAFELCVNAAVPGKEEYLDSEKYEIKQWNWDQEGNLKDFLARLNRIRRENQALQSTWNLKFCHIDNEYLLCYQRFVDDQSNIILVIVNLDPYHTQSGWVRIPLAEWGITPSQSFLAHDLISQDRYIWQGEYNYIELNPQICPAHILKIHRRLHREQDFDYYM